MANSASTAVYAQGDIKNYAIWKSIMNSMPIILTIVAFKMGGGPIWLYIPMIVVWAIGGNIVIIYYAKKKCGLKIVEYVKKVIFPLIVALSLMLLIGVLPILLLKASLLRLIITSFSTTVGLIIAMIVYSATKEEKGALLSIIRKMIKR